jgi:polysaccharide biosynthesis transport protein
MNGEPQAVVSLRPYLDVLYRHRLVSLCLAAVGFGVTLCLLMMLPDVYRSSTVVLIEPQEVAPVYVTSPSSSDLVNRVRILTQEATSQEQLERIIRELNLYPLQRASGEPMDIIADYMRRHILIDYSDQKDQAPTSASAQINSLRISFEYTVPSIAQNVTTRLADIYINEDLKQRTDRALAANQFLEDQVATARAKLDASTNTIKAYKTQYAGVLPENLAYNLEQLNRLEDQLTTAESEARGLISTHGGESQLSPEVRLKEMQTRLTTMRAEYSDQFPDVKSLRAEIASLKKFIGTESLAGKTDVQTQHDQADTAIHERLDTRMNSLKTEITQCERRIAETPKHEQELGALQRDNEILAYNFEQLQKKQFDAQTSVQLEEREEGGRFRVLDPAILPLKPERPNRPAIGAAGVLFSLGAAVALPFAIFFTDTSFKEPEELSREYGLPVLVTIPLQHEMPGASERRWFAIRAIALSGLALMVSATAVWLYATRMF